MDPTRISLFDLADQRLAWLDRRQQVLAQNIANADTPGWRARDLLPFDAALTGLAPRRTDPRHLSGSAGGRLAGTRAVSGETAPDGNAVALDAELTKVADTETAQELVTTLYSKYLGMFRTALGRSA